MIRLILLIILLQAIRPGDISRLKPVTQEFFEYLQQDRYGNKQNIPLIKTYAPRSWYTQDWLQPSWAAVEYIYIWNSPIGPRIRFMTSTPAVLAGCKIGLDAMLANVDETIPTTDPCYFFWFDKWVTRPAIDLEDLLQEPALRAVWIRLLEKHGHNRLHPKFSRELEFLGFDRITGIPPTVYRVNLQVDWDNLTGPPVVTETSLPQPETVPQELRWEPTHTDWIAPIVLTIIGILSLIAVLVRRALRIRV